MNLFELFVKVGVDDQASSKLNGITSKLGKGLATAAKIGTAAVGAAASGIAALTGAAVKNYAEYEQLVGGVETLFKGSADKVKEYAANAYQTAGMSANEYMSTVTSFSASLLQSLGGDTDKAAEYANQALTDMSDNANKMGASMELIQNAYQGFAKQNYTMLDNLKLGYGGTKEEMARLIKDASKLDKSIKANDMSFANIVKAINVVQTEMGITGTTAKEAGRTIEGSVNAMKSAWTNLVTGFADKNADLEGLINDLVTTIVGDGTENNLGVLGNILPAVETALVGVGKLIENAIPILIEMLPSLLRQVVPVLISSATSLVNTVVDVLPELVDLIVDALIENAPALLVAAVELILALAMGLIEAAPKLIAAIPEIVSKLVEGFKNSETVKKFLEVGKNIIDGIKNGISNAWNNLVQWFKNLFSDLIGVAKKILGIASPSKVFKKIGAFTAEGFGAGFEDAFGAVERDIQNALDFNGTTFGVNAYGSYSGGGALSGIGGTSFGTVNINIDGYNAQDDDELAETIAEKLQIMTERKGAVFA